MLCRRFVKAETALVEFVRRLIGANDIDYDSRVAQSELQHAERNRAMAHFMASFGNMQMPPDTVIDAYCRQCAITMNCVERARALFLANGGVAPVTGERIVDSSSAKRLSALMLTCGTYDAAGISCIASGCLRKAVSAAGSSRCCRARWPCACGRRPMRTGTRWRGRWRWSG